MVIRAVIAGHPPCMSSFTSSALDPMDVELRFLAEGNANVIFRIVYDRPPSARHHRPPEPDARRLPESDWRHCDNPARQRQYNRDMLRRRRELMLPYELDAQPTRAPDFVIPADNAHLTGSSKETLLRLKKVVSFYQDDRTTYDFYVQTVADWIPQRHLVQHHLIELGADMVERCNEELRSQERSGLREDKRRGTYLHPTKFALLTRDMNSYDAQKSVTLEFKPKWLWQSPTAPGDATRCRTCALRALRGSQGEKESKAHGVACPLSIATGRPELVREVVESLVDNPANYVGCKPSWLEPEPPANQRQNQSQGQMQTRRNPPISGERRPALKSREDLVLRLYNHFLLDGEGHRVLQGLQNLQKMFDPKGILSSDKNPTDEFLLAMTLRDCSLYLQVHWDDNRIESRLGDLDPKVAKGGKLEQWRQTERTLLEGAWYRAPEGNECLLSRQDRPSATPSRPKHSRGPT